MVEQEIFKIGFQPKKNHCHQVILVMVVCVCLCVLASLKRPFGRDKINDAVRLNRIRIE